MLIQKDLKSELCLVELDFQKSNGYQTSYLCPLKKELTQQNGIQMKLIKNENCQFNEGDEISRYIFLSQDGTIYLDQ